MPSDKISLKYRTYNKSYMKSWHRRPEVKERQREYVRVYQQRPEIKERLRQYNKEYQKNPEVIARRNELARQKRATPEGRERSNKNGRNNYSKHRQKILAELKRRRLEEPGFAERQSQKVKDYVKRTKDKIFAVLGRSCACCGESAPEFLTIDHIGGGGTKHRKSVGGNAAMYLAIIREGIPKDKYRTLCMNCNFSFGHWGRCPHGNIPEK